MSWMLFTFLVINAAEYAKYHFYTDLGEIVPDRSDNEFYAVNGGDH